MLWLCLREGLIIYYFNAKLTDVKSEKKMTNKKQKKIELFSRAGLIALAVISSISFGLASFSIAQADQFDAKIRALNEKNGDLKEEKDQLGAQASSLQELIGKLQSQINAKERQIAAHEKEVTKLKQEIKKAENELKKQRSFLGETIKDMYVEGDISTVEMLASSKNLSDFFDKQQYRESVRSKIKTTVDKINQLKLDLNTRKYKVEKLLTEQKKLREDLLSQQNEKNRLLSLNQSEQNQLSSSLKKNNARIAELRRQQAAANAALFGGVHVVAGSNGRDSYPNMWRNAPQDSMIDSWGMYNRECVSYTAWKVHESGKHMPYWGGRGNANQWDDNARAEGIPVSSKPKAGDVAISNSGFYGHAMYVESVNGNGTINVSQYNWGLDGRYSEAYNLPTGGLVFIRFR